FPVDGYRRGARLSRLANTCGAVFSIADFFLFCSLRHWRQIPCTARRLRRSTSWSCETPNWGVHNAQVRSRPALNDHTQHIKRRNKRPLGTREISGRRMNQRIPALSARMDPEDLREVISAYQKCAAEIVQRFDGFVAKYMGDGVLVCFGYPQAHEDDA